MEVDVVTECIIERPVSEVAAFSADPDNVPRWYENIKQVEWQTPRPVTLGSRIAFVAYFLGRRIAYTYEVTQFEPRVCLVMRTAEGPFPMETTYTWKTLGGSRTHMTLRNRGKPSGFFALVAPFMKMAIRRANQKDLQLLKATLENPPHDSLT
jgi:hypothetical protein